MKKLLVILFVLSFLKLGFAQSQFVPIENQIILNDKIETAFDLVEGENKSNRWQPEYSDLKMVNKMILEFLNNANSNEKLTMFQKNEIKKILNQITKYRVQYVGISVEGKMRIWCNFFPAPIKDDEDHFNYWKSNVVFVLDGGFNFWQIEYDVELGKCLNITSNGYA